MSRAKCNKKKTLRGSKLTR